MKCYKHLTRDEIVSKTAIGKPLGFPIPNEDVILTDLCALMEYKGGECVCCLAFSLDGEREFAVSFSSLTRWGIKDEAGDENSPRFGMFKETQYDNLFGNQLLFRWHKLDVSEKQELYVPKWAGKENGWDFSVLRKREYPLIKVTKATTADFNKVKKLYTSAVRAGWVSFYEEKFKKDAEE